MATTTTPAAAPPAPRARIRLPDAVSVLAERDFRVIWTGQAISMVGTWMQMVAQGLLVLTLWNSAFALGALNFANAVPSLLVMLFGGVLADRADKRRILIVTQAVMAVLALAVGVLIISDAVQYWMLIVATVALGIAFGYDMPSYQAYLPELVPPEKIGQVVALNSSTFHGSRMVGPAMAGIVIGAFGMATAYFLNAASFIAVIVSLLIIRSRPMPLASRAESAFEGLKAGLRHARGRANLRAMLWLTALNTTFLFPTVAVLTPFYVKNVLHEGPAVLGLLWAGSGLGSLFGAFALIWWGARARAARIVLAAVFAPVGLLILALVHESMVALAIMPFLSFSFSSQLGLIQTMIQESTPAQFRGRVMSLHGITFNSTMPLAALAFSALAVATDLPFVMVTCALLYSVAAMTVLRFADGGITKVVADSRAEYDIIAFEPSRAGPDLRDRPPQ
jgi:MFS family permease